MSDAEFSWVKVDATSILGSARPNDVAGLLKKSTVWHQLYTGWLDQHHPDHTAGWRFVEQCGGRPRLQGRERYDEWVTALDGLFDSFYADVGALKQALDPKTGSSRRLAHLTGRVAAKAGEVAESKYAVRAAEAVGGRQLRNLAAGAANQVGTAIGPSGPQSVAQSAPVRQLPAEQASPYAHRLITCEEIRFYLQWLNKLHGELSWYGGALGEHCAVLASLATDLNAWRGEVRNRIDAGADGQDVREAVYWVAYHLDLRPTAEAPHHVLARMVTGLHEREAVALYARLHPYFEDLRASVDSMYYNGAEALIFADTAYGESVGEHQLPLYRTELPNLLPAPQSGVEPTEADETAARELFERPFDDFVS